MSKLNCTVIKLDTCKSFNKKIYIYKKVLCILWLLAQIAQIFNILTFILTLNLNILMQMAIIRKKNYHIIIFNLFKNVTLYFKQKMNLQNTLNAYHNQSIVVFRLITIIYCLLFFINNLNYLRQNLFPLCVMSNYLDNCILLFTIYLQCIPTYLKFKAYNFVPIEFYDV